MENIGSLQRFSTNLAPLQPQSNPLPFAGFDEEQIIVPMNKKRNIPKIPYKVLDAPSLLDDFYLNLVDWSN